MTAKSVGGQVRIRCAWCGEDPLYIRYHDEEWGVPVRDERRLFEKLCLEGAQAGLSWITVLRKRENYRRLFDRFDPERVARFAPRKVEQLLLDPGIIRNRLKIESAISNARCVLALRDRGTPLDALLWEFTAGKTIQNRRKSLRDLPATTPVSDAMSKALKHFGFRFVGSTICYAMMQSVGMVNDHLIECYRHKELPS